MLDLCFTVDFAIQGPTRTAWTLVTRYSLPHWRGSRVTPGRARVED
ncbi:hypothetical protein [Streptomyces albipurpureus]|uniref:Uncharacterized protein n=1 Tax=Streptomyces albipurpureus TaxID=2897419 RepID=A0ABT0UZJ5_9ACTN|nr:hypothetical protein [Streptomyces sp. CWNU-1]MCM2392738.1 hypothetical protein [Streptomyces sp. CWNU-1]